MTDLRIRPLGPHDAPKLALLIAENAQAVKRGAPRRPDEVYAEAMIENNQVELLGAYDDGELIGFAAFYDLPDLTSGLNFGQLEDIYVKPEYQGKGIGRALIGQLDEISKKRDWENIRWMVPAKPVVDVGLTGLYERIGEPGEKTSYFINTDKLESL
ncbi:GNAT family N-acetyltransferase [Polycladidibacter stylochi]|uniref:GNAT family N-acetyltransferase n=1 Tax=Polycladidibacter stylochi TaxID=1807766 RepID=UPI0008323694|nr:GNAT family N-acetyltransferase [Pseudovibrio stylochi]